MGAAVSVKELGWQIRQNSSADQAPKNFNVQASNDNSSWVTVASFTDATGWGNPMRFFSW